MSTSHKRDADVDRLLRTVLKPEPRNGLEDCPDAAVLASFVEGGLTSGEQSALEVHLAGCGRCQEALAVLAHDLPEEATAEAAVPETRWFTWVTRPRLRWLVPISAAATVGVVFLATRPLIAPESAEVFPADVVQMAQAPPEQAAMPAPRLDALREEAAAPAKESAAPKGQQETRVTRVGQASEPKQVSETPSGVPSAGERMRDKQAVDPAAEMMAARVASEETRAQPAAPAAPAQGQLARAASEFGRGAGAPGAPARSAWNLEAGLVTVSAPGGIVQWRFGPGGRLLRSADGGASWQPQASGATADLLAGAALSPSVCWAVGTGGVVLLTVDGQRWTLLPFPLRVDLAAVQAINDRIATVTTRDGRRFETLDAGLTWSPKQ